MRLGFTALLLLAAGAAQGQDGLATRIEGGRLDEGRPGTVRATWTNAGKTPLLVQRLKLVVTQGSRRWASERRSARVVSARSLEPVARELVSLELTASEAMHPAVARLPMPPVQASLEGTPHHALRLLAPGRSVRLSVEVVPGAGRLAVTASAAVIAVPQPAFARAGVTTWTTARAGGPGIRPGRDPLGARPKGAQPQVPIQVRLTRWAPWAGGPTSELLVAPQREALKGARAEFRVTAAPFTQAQAQARASVQAVHRAALLKDGRWILQGADRFWVVGPRGPVLDGRGSLFPLALDLAKRGEGGFAWFAGPADASLGAALKAAKFGVDRGKAWSIKVTAARLAEYLALLAQHGVYPTARGLTRTPPGPAKARSLTVDAKLLPNYPAALVSLDDGKVRTLPKLDRLKGWEAKGDLWIEPDDPEVAGLTKAWEGAVHPGQDTRVAPVATGFDALRAAPARAAWKARLERAEIGAGKVFLVRSSSGKLYKVELQTVEKTRIVLRYAPLPR